MALAGEQCNITFVQRMRSAAKLPSAEQLKRELCARAISAQHLRTHKTNIMEWSQTAVNESTFTFYILGATAAFQLGATAGVQPNPKPYDMIKLALDFPDMAQQASIIHSLSLRRPPCSRLYCL